VVQVQEFRPFTSIEPTPSQEGGLPLGVLLGRPLPQQQQVGVIDEKFFHGAPGIQQSFQAKRLTWFTEKFREAVHHLRAQWPPPIQVDGTAEPRRKDFDVLADLGVTQDPPLPFGKRDLAAALVGVRFPTTAALHEQSLKPLPPILQILQILKGRTRRPRSIGIPPVRNRRLGVWLRQL